MSTGMLVRTLYDGTESACVLSFFNLSADSFARTQKKYDNLKHGGIDMS